MRGTIVLAAAGLALAAILSPAEAHEGATGVVKERMDAMTEMGKAAKSIAERLRANRDLAAIKDEARTIQLASSRIPSLFPPGSDQKPTEAKPEVWTDWAGFSAKAAQLQDASGKLAAALDGGTPTEIGARFRAVAAVCSDCHRAYRNKSADQ